MYRKKTKAFDMQRSILPSKARKSARWGKRAVQHQNRAENYQRLHKLRGYADEVLDIYEDDEIDNFNHAHTPKDGYDSVVEDRRGADKINHFMRWAGEVTKGMDEHEAWSYLKSICPPGLIGDHALSHLEYKFNPNWNPWWRHYRRIPRPLTEAESKAAAANEAVKAKLEEIFSDPAKTKKFNHNFYYYWLNQARAVEKRLRRWSPSEVYGDRFKPEMSWKYWEWTADNWNGYFQKTAAVYVDHKYNWHEQTYKEIFAQRWLTKYIFGYCKVDVPK